MPRKKNNPLLQPSEGLSLSTLKQLPSLSTQCKWVVKNALLNGDLEYGVLYTENQLARSLGVSRTPVREAVMELASLGMITILPRRGFHLNVFTAQDIEEIYELRWMLESSAVRKLTATPEKFDFARLESMVKAQRGSLDTRNKEEYISTGQGFHRELIELCNNKHLLRIYESIGDTIHMAWMQAVAHQRRTSSDVVDDHGKLLALICGGKTEEALELLAAHLDNSKRSALAAQA